MRGIQGGRGGRVPCTTHNRQTLGPNRVQGFSGDPLNPMACQTAPKGQPSFWPGFRVNLVHIHTDAYSLQPCRLSWHATLGASLVGLGGSLKACKGTSFNLAPCQSHPWVLQAVQAAAPSTTSLVHAGVPKGAWSNEVAKTPTTSWHVDACIHAA